MKSKLFLIAIIISCYFGQDIMAQFGLNGFDCQLLTNPYANSQTGTPFEGVYKPNRTDTLNGVPLSSSAYFPILVVFVQFKDEPSDPRNTWPQNGDPIYLDSLIATSKYSSGNWWNYYSPYTQAISSHWIEVSRGRFHAISPSGAFSVVLPKTPLEYWTASGYNNSVAERMVHQDIWASLKDQGLTDWSMYDRWKKIGDDFVYCNLGQGDGYVDMIYKVMKSPGRFTYNGKDTSIMWNVGGYNCLGYFYPGTDTVDADNNILVDYFVGDLGSGITISYRGIKEQYIGTMGHECKFPLKIDPFFSGKMTHLN